MKLCSNLILFEFAAPRELVFAQVLAYHCDGKYDSLTLNA